MKKCIIAFVAVWASLLCSFVAYADAIIADNEFYNRNRSEAIYLGRSFVANGVDGFVSVEEEPGSGRDVAKLQNGEVAYLWYSCLFNGDYWGLSFEYSGWVKTDEMLVLYDYVAFEEEHFEEFYAYAGDCAAIRETRSAIAWPWPGAEKALWTYEDLDTDSFRVVQAYMDELGREWGFVAQLYSSSNVWVCLSEPLNSSIPAFNPAPEPMQWVSETVHTEIATGDEVPMILIIVVLVAALAIGTLILKNALYKKAKDKTGGGGDD